MTDSAEHAALTDDQRRRVLGVLSIGGDRTMAAGYAGVTVHELRSAMRRDARLAIDIRGAEAAAEIGHMRRLEEASRNEKNWRISMWWLERVAADRFGRRPARTVSQSQLDGLFDEILVGLAEDIHSPGDRERMLRRIGRLAGLEHRGTVEAGLDSSLEASDEPLASGPPCKRIEPTLSE